LHVGYLFASTGQLTHSGGAGLVCSPATAPVGTACLPTERGGLLLLSVQLLAAAIFAGWVRGADSVIWRLARASLGALVTAVMRFGAALVSARIALVAVVPAAAFPLSPKENSAPRPRLSLFVRQCGRRGPPPRCRFDLSSSPSAPVPVAIVF
jgi:hypothetical protein